MCNTASITFHEKITIFKQKIEYLTDNTIKNMIEIYVSTVWIIGNNILYKLFNTEDNNKYEYIITS